MRITDTTASSRTTSARRKADRGGSSFSLGSSSPTASTGLTGGGPAAAVGSLLALQAIDDQAEQQRRSHAFGHALLDELDSLKVSLLTGGMTGSQVKNLVTLVENRPRSDAEDLEQLVSEIELRAKVELAKLSQPG